MHPSALKNFQEFLDRYAAELIAGNARPRMIDIGSQDVNGSLKSLCPPAFDYTGVDFVPGRGVDVVLDDPYALPFESESADIVAASSVFEHSEMFWLLFHEIQRILKPAGLFYLNVPSNGEFHRYPVDCWRFYPDSGGALAAWARRNGMHTELLESYTSAQDGSHWNDFVAVFVKDGRHAATYPRRILDTKSDIFNGVLRGREDFLQPSAAPQDLVMLRSLTASTSDKGAPPRRVAGFATVTAICVDTVHHALALSACRRMATHGFAEVVLVTDDQVDRHLTEALAAGLRIEKIAPLRGKGAYSRYVLHSLADDVRTEHALVFQWDGFVDDPAQWWPGFLDYDYVGAVWPQPYACGDRRVGNGGFSLRSTKLLRAVRSLAGETGDAPEDNVICCTLGERLEREFGVRFAPPEVAKHFSVEHLTLPWFADDPNRSPARTFGFHGFFNFHLAFSDQELLELVDAIEPAERTSILASWEATALLVNLKHDGRDRLVRELADRMGMAAGMADVRAATPQQVIDHILGSLRQPAGAAGAAPSPAN